jgi:quercetin 2,3-dioxygenase
VSNTEPAPDELACGASPFAGVLHAREVPLGGPRAIRVRRTLPQRERSLIGGWCFVDHYGPHDLSIGPGMDVAPHPHSGLQTVSWLFSGEVEHRDSAGVHAMIRPGELNLMTAGAGICHSEVSVAGSGPATRMLHGAQLWVAPLGVDDARLRVFLGELAGTRSPVSTFTPLLGAQIDLRPRSSVTFDVDRSFEHGVLLDQGSVVAGGATLDVADLWYQSPGNDSLTLANPGDRPARVLLLGGPPFPEQLVMWWNFVGRSHDEIALYRQLWQDHDARFGEVSGYPGARLPAPPLPNAKLQPRPNPTDGVS